MESNAKKPGYLKFENRHEAKQKDFSKIAGSPVAYWVEDKIKNTVDIKMLL